MNLPKISVLVPAYNAAPYLGKLLDSVRKQTFKSWELILVNDGSGDDTEQVVTRYLKKHHHVPIGAAWIEHLGASAALKVAIELSSAPLCTFVGADDLLPPTSLETIVKAFRRNPGVDYIWTRYMCRAERSTYWKEGRSKALPKGMTLKQALLSGWWGALAQDSFRRSAYNKTPGLDPNIPYVVDQQLAMLFANLGCEVMHVPTVTYLHIQHSKQMSAVHYKDQQRCRAIVLGKLGGKYCREK